MAGIDLTGLTMNPIEIESIKDFILERVFERPEIQAIHGSIKTGIAVKEQIAFASEFGKTGLKKGATCARQTSSPESTLTEKFWDPIGIEDTLVICQTEVNALFKAYYSKITKYRDLYDISGSDMEIFYAIQLENSMVRTIWRAAWFADVNIAVAGAATSGVILAADVKFYDYFDGLWPQIFDAVTATTVERVTITENSVVTSKAAQLALAANAATGYFKAIDNVADSRLRSDPNAKYYVSRELFQNYIDELETAGKSYNIDIMQDGLQSVKWRNYPIVNMENIWGLSSREDFVNNTTDAVYDLPHRIVFTVPDNIPIGTLNESDFSELEQWYNQDDRENKTAYGFTEDAKLLEEYMLVTAY